MTKRNKILVAVLLLFCVLLAAAPVLTLRGAAFGGSDDAGSVKVSEITGEEYEPWFTPVFEQMLGGGKEPALEPPPGDIGAEIHQLAQLPFRVGAHTGKDPADGGLDQVPVQVGRLFHRAGRLLCE